MNSQPQSREVPAWVPDAQDLQPDGEFPASGPDGGDRLTRMVAAHPLEHPVDAGIYARCIETCLETSAIATLCASACLAEEHVASLRDCIEDTLHCAATASATADSLAQLPVRHLDSLRHQIETCLAACSRAAERCANHAGEHEHCAVCAEACRECERACNKLLADLAGRG